MPEVDTFFPEHELPLSVEVLLSIGRRPVRRNRCKCKNFSKGALWKTNMVKLLMKTSILHKLPFFNVSDIDECLLNLDDCAANGSWCTNGKGSYRCGCRSGYSGDGKACVGEYIIQN